MNKHLLIGALLLLLASAGCRGMESENRPIHPNLNMDFQERYNAQESNDFFENGMAMRQPVPGTVAKGFLREDVRFYSGQTESGRYVSKVPVPVTRALLERGRDRYNIYCTPCHGQAGFGQGVVMTGNYGFTPAPTYHKAALRDTADGYLFEVITNGVRNMPGYAAQVPVADRWAIVSYIRALQRSQNAQRENVPPSVLARIEQTGSANMNAARNPAGPATTGGGGGSATGGGTSGSEASSSEADASTENGTDGGAGTEREAADTVAADTSAQGGGSTAGMTASADTAAGVAQDTADGATVAATTGAEEEGAPAAGAGQDSVAATSSAGEGGGFFSSTFFVFLIVVLPIAALTVMLVVAFRKDRDH